MAPLLRALVLVALAGLATCDSLDNVDVEAGGSATIPAATPLDVLLEALPIGGFQDIDFESEFANQGVTKDDVDSVHITEMTLIITDPPGDTFDFIDEVVFYAVAEGQPRLEIARSSPVPSGESILRLDVAENAELKPYVVAPSMTIVSEVVGSRPPRQTTIEASVVLDVDITVPGC